MHITAQKKGKGVFLRFVACFLALLFSVTIGLVQDVRAWVQIGDYEESVFETPHPYPEGGTEVVPVWEDVIHVPDASYIAVHFETFDLAEGDIIILSDPTGFYNHVYEGKGYMDLGGGFWALSVTGDTLIITLYAQGVEPSRFGYRIDRFAHGYPFSETEGEVGIEAICGPDDSIDAMCYETSFPEAYQKSRAVVKLLKNGSSHCTGWLVSCENHIMTNQHCIGSQSELDQIEFQFMYQRPSCGSGTATYQLQLQGGTYLRSYSSLDYSLLIPNLGPYDPQSVYGYIQIDNRLPNINEQIYIPGHPAGVPKRLALESTHSQDQSGYCEVYSTSQTPCSGGSGDIGYYCDTQGGSSGSPVLSRESNKAIALHHCANCPNRGVRVTEICDHVGDLLPPCAGCVAECIDEDGDGYGNPSTPLCDYPDEDCDDSNSNVNPGATEGPDGDPNCSDTLDNDCDGDADINDIGCVECIDNDIDGYGILASGNCTHPEQDCDDSDPGINPGATEICDGADNNCFNGVDEEPNASNNCDNGVFCDGAEACETATCQAGSDPCPNDGLYCNGVEECDETGDQCTTTGNPCPDDGIYCNGEEGCDEVGDQCTTTGDPCVDDSLCTDDLCYEETDTCENPCNAVGPEDPCCEDPGCAGTAICFCIDNDDDGFGLPGDPSCPDPREDCDDTNPDVNPGMFEGPYGDATCLDSFDNDCDGPSDYRDLDCLYPLFGPDTKYGSGDEPVSIATEDLNGDDVLDLAVVHLQTDQVSILLGNGDGSFQTAVNYGVGDEPVSVAIGDLDEDNAPDLVVANENNDNVSILMGNGDGTFQTGWDAYVPGRPSFVAMADLNGDDHLDLAVACAGYPGEMGNVSVLLGNGGGAFQGYVPYETGYDSMSVAVGDLNEDEAPDLVVANENNDNISILMGNGDGTLQEAMNPYIPGRPSSVKIVDLNGDDHLDLAIACTGYTGEKGNVSVLLGDGGGAFLGYEIYETGNDSVSIVVGLFNEDTSPDLVVTNRDDDEVSVLVGNGDGTFETVVNHGVGDGPASVALGDLNEDDTLDLAVANQYSDNVSILINKLGDPCTDLDGDGYGDPPSIACSHLFWDCNDSEPAINPGALEVCDGQDNTCDGVVDGEPGVSESCQNGLFCDGEEFCEAGSCQAGTPVACSDGVGCTIDTCNEETDACGSTPSDANCDDGEWCNGGETCDVTNDCQDGTPIDCDDDVACTLDSCNDETDRCDNLIDHTSCDDGLWCNGVEACDALNDCQPGEGNPCTFPLVCNEDMDACVGCIVDGDCDDGVGCTVDTCETDTATCNNDPQDTHCDDGLYCNGAETCDPMADCQAGTTVDCDDGNDCTDDSCNENEDLCETLCNASGPDDSCCGDPACAEGPDCVAECVDNDGDGYGDPASGACTNPEWDCNDTNPKINPAAPEVCNNSIDDNCNGSVDEGCDYSAVANAEAAVFGSSSVRVSGVFNEFALFVIPAFVVVSLRTIRRRKQRAYGSMK